MRRWWSQRGWICLLVAVIVGAVGLAEGVGRAWASSFMFRVTLGADRSSFVSTVELGAAERTHRGAEEAHTLSVTKAFTVDGGIGTVQVGQEFDSAVLQIFNDTGALLATYQLSAVKVTSMRLSGAPEAATQGITLSFKALAVSFP